MEPENSLQCSQQAILCLYTELDESSLQPHNIYI